MVTSGGKIKCSTSHYDNSNNKNWAMEWHNKSNGTKTTENKKNAKILLIKLKVVHSFWMRIAKTRWEWCKKRAKKNPNQQGTRRSKKTNKKQKIIHNTMESKSESSVTFCMEFINIITILNLVCPLYINDFRNFMHFDITNFISILMLFYCMMRWPSQYRCPDISTHTPQWYIRDESIQNCYSFEYGTQFTFSTLLSLGSKPLEKQHILKKILMESFWKKRCPL